MIVTNGLTKVYRLEDIVVNALAGVTLTVEDGEFVALMGPSGSGKSTLMYILGLLDTPTDGQYALDGIPTATLDDDQLADLRNEKIGFVFQNYNLLPRVPALRQVELPLLYMGAANRKELAEEALSAVGLQDRMHHRPTEMSGGQQQRVAIARAIVTNPRLVLADEPTGNLDSRTSHEILDLLEELNHDRGITIMIVTHERDIAQRCGRVIMMRDGLIVGDEVKRAAPVLRPIAA